MIEKLYTVEQVAELASVTGRTIRNYLKSGRLVGRKIGGQWRFPESEVQNLLTGADEPAPVSEAHVPESSAPPEPVATQAEPVEEMDFSLSTFDEPVSSTPAAPPAYFGQPVGSQAPTQQHAAHAASPNHLPPAAPPYPGGNIAPLPESFPPPPPQADTAALGTGAYYKDLATLPQSQMPQPTGAPWPAAPSAPWQPAQPVSTSPQPPLEEPPSSQNYYSAPAPAPMAAVEPTAPVPQPPATTEPSLLDSLSDVGRKAAEFSSQLHLNKKGGSCCSILDVYQPLETAKRNIDELAHMVEREKRRYPECDVFLEYDERFSVARYTIYGTLQFLEKCIHLVQP